MRLAARLPKLALKLALAIVLGLLLFEGALRAVVHLDASRDVFAGLRKPGNFASRWDDDYWKLEYLFTPSDATADARNFDPITGWRSERIQPVTYEHVDRESIGERRPVLLYGDSFAYCFTSDGDCWQGLLERSEFGGQYALLNYGTNGFGLDQCWLMYQQSIGLYAAQKPVVVISMLIDDDFDRCLVSIRGWPKPRFTLGSGLALDLHPPEAGGVREQFLDEHPLDLGSYAWSFIVHGTSWISKERRAEFAHQPEASALAQQVSSRILLEWKQDLDRRGLEYFAVLFHNREHIAQQSVSAWRETFAVTQLTRLGIPFVSSKLRLIDDARAHARAPDEYYFSDGPGIHHYNALGNTVVFDCFRAGLERRFDSAETTLDAEPATQPGP